ncbi:MAG TPA: hypothetical protein VIF57_19150 [Polyangia bacterium]
MIRAALFLAVFAVPLAVPLAVSPAARAQGAAPADRGDRWPAPVGADITLIGPEAAVASVRAVAAELLARDGVAVVWHQVAKLRAEEMFATPPGDRAAPVFVWVDVASAREARITFRAAAGSRFVIRRVALPGGVGPLAVEEIAQIIQSVLHALASDTGWALSLPEARVALSVPEPRPAPPPPAPARATVVAVGSAVRGQLYAPDLPPTADLEVAIEAISRVAGAPWSPGSLGGRLVLAYGFPARFAGGAVGADLRVATLRLQLVWEPWRRGRAALRIGVGGGADRVVYTPTAEQPGAMTAAGGTFVSPVGCLDAALRLEVAARVAVNAGLLAELALQRVHYDAYDAQGRLNEVLIPYRLRPGLAIGLEVRL